VVWQSICLIGDVAIEAGAPADPRNGPVLEPALWHWIAFGAFIVMMLTLDLVVFHRKAHEPSLRESAFWTLFWAGLALAFNALIWVAGGPRSSDAAIYFLTGYLVEWSLSMDNVFVFAVIFGYFRVPLKYQYRVLFWGILGAIVMRLVFILVGATLIHYFEGILLVFGILLIVTGAKLAFKNDEVHPEKNLFMRIGRKLFRVSKEMHGDHFFVREHGKLCVTPLFLVLLVIESSDVLFAIDSVPAIFGITQDPFIVFSSNIFAILGLRALYFLLAGVMNLFRYLSYGLAAVLMFVGIKMVAEYVLPHWFDIEFHFFKDYPWASLLVIISLLGTSIIASLIAESRDRRRGPPPADPTAPTGPASEAAAQPNLSE
jgi:tellurite resistance protein TerC